MLQPGKNPPGSDDDRRMLRGGSWFNGSEYARSASRDRLGPDNRFNGIGFRVLCSGPL
jgi:formylglycine-generating enzyme required for sulfatase activity